MVLWDYAYEGSARKHFRWWYRWATHSRLPAMIDKARMLKRRLENILTYLKHPITNAISESLNSKIQWVKYTARGFRNFANFVTAIYFHCGGLDLSCTFRKNLTTTRPGRRDASRAGGIFARAWPSGVRRKFVSANTSGVGL